MDIDRHHVLFDRKSWEARDDGLFLRRSPSMIPKLERQTHTELHENCPPVPVPDAFSLQRIRHAFRPEGDPLDDIDQLMLLVEQMTRRRDCHEISRELGQLTIMALDVQRPYIEYGMIIGGRQHG